MEEKSAKATATTAVNLAEFTARQENSPISAHREAAIKCAANAKRVVAEVASVKVEVARARQVLQERWKEYELILHGGRSDTVAVNETRPMASNQHGIGTTTIPELPGAEIHSGTGVISDESEDGAVIDDPIIHGGSVNGVEVDDECHNPPNDPPNQIPISPPKFTCAQTRDPEASFPPSKDDVRRAYTDITDVLEPRKNGQKCDPDLDGWTRTAMKELFWATAAKIVARRFDHSESWSEQLRKCRNYILDRLKLPENPYGGWIRSLPMENEDLRQEITTHLQ